MKKIIVVLVVALLLIPISVSAHGSDEQHAKETASTTSGSAKTITIAWLSTAAIAGGAYYLNRNKKN